MSAIDETKNHSGEIFILFDRYLKANNNFLPLQAYLQYLESENFDGFTSICHYKSLLKDLDPSDSLNKLNSPTAFNSNNDSNLGSTLTIIDKITNCPQALDDSPDLNKSSPQNQTEVVLAQKLYKIIVSIDYSPQTTSLDFINKSLEKLFEKISNEYNEFYQTCANIEPQIYVTVLVWNLAYFDGHSSKAYENANDLKYPKSINPLPFAIICLSKRLLKSNLQEISKFIFKELINIKNLFLDPFRIQETDDYKNQYEVNGEPATQASKIGSNSKSLLNKENATSFFEELLDNIIKIFNYFVVNEFSCATMAPTALAICHHVHITEG